MNTSVNAEQIHATARVTARTTPVGFRRRTVAGTLLVAALTAIAVGFAATSHADDGPNPGTDAAIVAPAPAAPLLPPPPPPVLPWLEGMLDRALHPQIHCGFQRVDSYRCDWF
jgi:hypothetical protein